MNTFPIWVWPFDYEYLACIKGMENARWLGDSLDTSANDDR